MTTDADAAHHDPASEQSDHTDGAGETPGEQPIEPQPERAIIAVSQLAAHPGNVRADLDLNEEFVHSVAVNGVLTALRITPDGEGFRVIDGGRRLAAALKTGTERVPYDLVAERAGDEAGQFLDMINMNRHRNPLTVLEEADALFAAKKAGATRTRLRKATGMSPAAVNDALAAARLSDDTRSRMDGLDEQLSLDHYAILAEFQHDPDATGRLLAVAGWGGSLEHEAERIRQERADQAEHDRLRTELEEAGYAITAFLPAAGQTLVSLLHDGELLTPETHISCPGRGVYFRSYDLTRPIHYCADPATYGHTARYAALADAPAPGGADVPRPAEPPAEEPPDPSRRIVIEGNKAWVAATEVRRRWLETLFARRTVPREVAQFITRQLLTMPEPVRSGLARAAGQALFSQLTGHDSHDWLQACVTAPSGRLPLAMFAPIATAYESAMSEGEGRSTWRTDRYSPCPRQQAADYLTLLATLGYQLSDIEQAVAEQRPYTGEAPPGQPLIGEVSEPAAEAEGGPADAEIAAGQADERGVGGEKIAGGHEPDPGTDAGAAEDQTAA
jgi:ParB family chromosome partitioning protein